MKYSCYNCNKKGVYTELSEDESKRLISHDGKYLCEKCAKGVELVSKETIKRINDYIKNKEGQHGN